MKKPKERTGMEVFLSDYLPYICILAGFAYASWMILTYGVTP